MNIKLVLRLIFLKHVKQTQAGITPMKKISFHKIIGGIRNTEHIICATYSDGGQDKTKPPTGFKKI